MEGPLRYYPKEGVWTSGSFRAGGRRGKARPLAFLCRWRPAKLEDGLSDWSATGRARWEGLKALDERTQALVKAKTGLWQVKDELYTLVMSDLDPLLAPTNQLGQFHNLLRIYIDF